MEACRTVFITVASYAVFSAKLALALPTLSFVEDKKASQVKSGLFVDNKDLDNGTAWFTASNLPRKTTSCILKIEGKSFTSKVTTSKSTSQCRFSPKNLTAGPSSVSVTTLNASGDILEARTISPVKVIDTSKQVGKILAIDVVEIPEKRVIHARVAAREEVSVTDPVNVQTKIYGESNIGSVALYLNEKLLNREQFVPYESSRLRLKNGKNTFCAVPYSWKYGTGTRGTSYCITLIRKKAISTPTPTPTKEPTPTRTPTSTPSSNDKILSQTWYGPALNATSLGNYPLFPSMENSIEFTALATGKLKSFQVYYIYKYPWNYSLNKPGYYKGDGGKYAISLYEIDNKGNKGDLLETVTFTPKLRLTKKPGQGAKENDSTNQDGKDVRFVHHLFKGQPRLSAGKRYALYFNNIHPQGEKNWISINGLHHHGLSLEDRGARANDNSLVIKIDGKLKKENVPVIGLYYDTDNDGVIDFSHGNGYQETVGGPEQSTETMVTSTQLLREQMTPAQTIIATGLTLTAGRCTGTTPLVYTIHTGEGDALVSGTISPQSSPKCTATEAQETQVTFPERVTLVKGKTYYLDFSSSSSSFIIPAVRHGLNSGYIVGEGTRFNDGFAEVGQKEKGSVKWRLIKVYDKQNKDRDLCFQLNTLPYTPPQETVKSPARSARGRK